ncbi:MAG: alkyl hydroperoxide reductase/Thiol specific antioxidant/Mal allergen [Proteobacteria bacterium]|nr:alkyl hydroperoxide reductase/Thiol specific antioxidant/Mal allergen [Pseudomonadota bacterium]
MTRRKLLLIGLSAALIALVAGVYLGAALTPAVTPVEASLSDSATARLFATRLDDSNGKPQAIAQWQGKTLVVNFWATWCPPCREEMPSFSRLHNKYTGNGVQFVGIALDTADNVSKFSQQLTVSYPLLIADSQGSELTRQLGNTSLALPYTVVLGATGDVKLARLGRVGEGELDALLAQMNPRQ